MSLVLGLCVAEPLCIICFPLRIALNIAELPSPIIDACRDLDFFCRVATPRLLTGNITCLTVCSEPQGLQYPDLAPLSRLTRLEQFSIFDVELNQPLPHLPALKSLWAFTSDLQLLTSVTATLENLDLYGETYDFRQRTTLSHFTRLCSFTYDFVKGVENLHPDVFPPTLRKITAALHDSQPLAFPAGGQLRYHNITHWKTAENVTWTRHAPL